MQVQVTAGAPRRVSALRVFRTARGLTQAELADLADVSRQTVGRVEDGYSTRTVTAHKLARALDLPVGLVFPGPRDGER